MTQEEIVKHLNENIKLLIDGNPWDYAKLFVQINENGTTTLSGDYYNNDIEEELDWFIDNECSEYIQLLLDHIKSNENKAFNTLEYRVNSDNTINYKYYLNEDYIEKEKEVFEKIRQEDEKIIYTSIGNLIVSCMTPNWDKGSLMAKMDGRNVKSLILTKKYGGKEETLELSQTNFNLLEDRITTLLAFTSSFELFYTKWNQLEFEIDKEGQFNINYNFDNV